MVTAEQMDTAIQARVVHLGIVNKHAIWCCVERCRRACLAGEARELWVDGVKRGYACATCTWGLR